MAGEDKAAPQKASPPRNGGAEGPRPRAPRSGGAGPGGAGQGRPGPRGTNQPPQNQPGPGGPTRGRQLWHGVAYIVVALIALYLFQHYLLSGVGSSTQLEYSQFKQDVAEKKIDTAVIGTSRITGTLKNPDPKATPAQYSTNYSAQADPDLVWQLQAAGVKYSFSAASSPLGGILLGLLPFIIIGGIWYFLYRRMPGRAVARAVAYSAWAGARPRR